MTRLSGSSDRSHRADQHLCRPACPEPASNCGTPDKESIGFDDAKNVFIEGDNLEVLKLMQKAYNDRIKLIYVDPPYNTGRDFVYDDDFQDTLQRYLEFSGQSDAVGHRRSAKHETAGRRHSSWLSMMYPRLVLARNLLRQDGLLFVSIDDNEVATLRSVLNEIFGEENFLSCIVWDRGHSQQQGQFKEYHEYVLAYARRKDRLSVFRDPEGGEIIAGAIKRPSKVNPVSEFRFPAGVSADMPDGSELTGTWGDAETTELVWGRFHVIDGKTTDEMILCSAWTQKSQMEAYFHGSDDVFDTRGQKLVDFYFSSTGKLKYKKERGALTPSTVQRWGTQGSASAALTEFLGEQLFDRPKPVQLVQDLVGWCTTGDDVVLDFFAGSGTTGHAVLAQNAKDGHARRFVCVNLPEAVPEGSGAASAGLQDVAAITRRRLQKAIEEIEGASTAGLRCFSLRESSFKEEDGSDGQMRLEAATLAENANLEHVVAEILVSEGVPLDVPWERTSIGDATLVVASGRAVVLSTDISRRCVDEALALRPNVLVFLEDGFAAADALKSDAFYSCQQLGIAMKTA